MNLSRCNQGHFYDKEKYATCPHCNSGAGSEDGITMAFTEDLSNDELAPTQPLEEATQPLQSSESQNGSAAVAQPNAAAQQMAASSIPAPPPLASSIPTPSPMVPPPNNVKSEEEDADVTVGFFDNIFDVPDDQKTDDAASSGKSASKNKGKSSPCVGWLISIAGNHVGEDFRLKVGKNFIGRDASMDVVLTNDKSVSRNRHAIVTYEPKQHLYLVQPGESSELTYLNNEVVLTPVRLNSYDMITVGEVNLLFMPLCGERFDWTELPEE